MLTRWALQMNRRLTKKDFEEWKKKMKPTLDLGWKDKYRYNPSCRGMSAEQSRAMEGNSRTSSAGSVQREPENLPRGANSTRVLSKRGHEEDNGEVSGPVPDSEPSLLTQQPLPQTRLATITENYYIG